MSKYYTYNKNSLKQLKDTFLRLVMVTGGVLAIVMPVTQLSTFASAKGGGIHGDSVTYVTRYTAETCPLPDLVKADYLEILSCGLVKRTGQDRDYFIRVDGFTNLTPVIRDIKQNVAIELPCGNIVTANKFTENAFAQTSPVPPPYRLYTESVKFTNTCNL